MKIVKPHCLFLFVLLMGCTKQNSLSITSSRQGSEQQDELVLPPPGDQGEVSLTPMDIDPINEGLSFINYFPVPAVSIAINPQGSLTRYTINPTTLNGYDTSLTSDFDGDGSKDIFLWNRTNHENRLVMRLFAKAPTVINNPLPPAQLNGYEKAVAGNFDGNAQADLFFWKSSTGINKVAFNDGAAFIVQDSPFTPTSIDDYSQLVAGDWNGDGLTDLFFWVPSNGVNRAAYFGPGTPTTSDEPVRRLTVDGDFNFVAAGRFSGGTRDELYFQNLSSGYNRFVMDVGGAANTRTNVIDPSDVNSSPKFYVGDFNGDGFADIVAVDSAANRVRYISHPLGGAGVKTDYLLSAL